MPLVGEVKKVNGDYYTWAACVDCGKERWVSLLRGKPVHPRCNRCAAKVRGQKHSGVDNYRWQGGKFKDRDGYILVLLRPDDFFFPMTTRNGYVREHRLVVAKHLGRNLQPWEQVHHKDGVKDHNTYSNLELTTVGNHSAEHNKGYRNGYQAGFLDGRSRRIQKLKALMEEQRKLIEALEGR